MLDPRPKVQTACCSALCTLTEMAGAELMTLHLPNIFGYIQQAFGLYGIKSSLILIDTISTIADTVGDGLADAAITQLFLPQLIRKFAELEDDDMRLFPLLECLTSVCTVIGLHIQVYAYDLYFRCLRIVGNTLTANAKADARANELLLKRMNSFRSDYTDSSGNVISVRAKSSSGVADLFSPGVKNGSFGDKNHLDGLPVGDTGDDDDEGDEDVPVKDFAICALDVISALCEGLEDKFVTLVDNSRDMLLQVTFACLQDSLPELRQSAFALTGDICKHGIVLIAPLTTQLIEMILRNLSPDHPMVCNNASWTVGELAIKVGGVTMLPYINRLMHTFIQLLHIKDEISPTLVENVAITVGRLGFINTPQLAELLPEFLEDWCL